jgi:hypothetical protein
MINVIMLIYFFISVMNGLLILIKIHDSNLKNYFIIVNHQDLMIIHLDQIVLFVATFYFLFFFYFII